MFANRFVNLAIDPERFGLRDFQGKHGENAKDAAVAGKVEAHLIRDLGLWDLAADP
jgi:hypothetical protein